MSCDISCNCGHMPLHHLRNKKEKKRNQIKENKKIKIKIKSSSIP